MANLPALSGQFALIAGGAAGAWLANNLHSGMNLTITKHISPDDDFMQAIGGGPQIVQNGALYNDPNPPAPQNMTARNPLTAVAITKNGTHALFAVFNGRFADTQKSTGLTPGEAARYMLAHGASQAMLFDGGGSSEMVARLPGQRWVSVINSPSGGRERPVANGLFVYKASAGESGHQFCGHKNAV
jgi:exopolysaccharide biosynthesis protein